MIRHSLQSSFISPQMIHLKTSLLCQHFCIEASLRYLPTQNFLPYWARVSLLHTPLGTLKLQVNATRANWKNLYKNRWTIICLVYQWNCSVEKKKQIWSLKIVGEWRTSSERLRAGAEPLRKKGLCCHGIFNQVLWHPIKSRGLWLLFQLGPHPGIFLHLCLLPYKIYKQEGKRTETPPCSLTFLNADSEATGVRELQLPPVPTLCYLL